MTWQIFALVAVGGGLGACARFVVDGLVMGGRAGSFPWGVAIINVSGSFALGLLTGLTQSSILDVPWLFVLGGGVLGGYTTFGTAMVDTVVLFRAGETREALTNGLAMIIVTVAVAMLGLLLGRSF